MLPSQNKCHCATRPWEDRSRLGRRAEFIVAPGNLIGSSWSDDERWKRSQELSGRNVSL
jgi:hypothetical protein